MMTTPERHYDDASLVFLMESGRSDDPHLAACQQCSESVAQYLAIRDVLGEEAVWDFRELNEEPVPSTIVNLRAFAMDMAREDEEAEAIVAALLAGSRETWMPRLQRHPEWRTAGVVRGLISRLDKALDTMPPDAVEITALATEITDHLGSNVYPVETELKLRGAAWRERAYALFYVGQFRPAIDAADRAIALFGATLVDEYDGARVDVMRAWIFRALDETRQALLLSRKAEETFRRFGDRSKLSAAGEAKAALLYSARDFRAAVAVWQQLEQRLPPDELHRRGVLLQNLAHAYREIGDYVRAQSHFELAMEAFAALGVESHAARARWHVGKMLMTRGEYAKALVFLSNLCDAFRRLGMRDEATLVSLDQAEVLLILGEHQQVVATCRDLVSQFEKHGLEHTRGALTALAYLSEAAEAGRCTPAVVEHVRNYVQRVNTQQQLLFVPLPE